MAIDVEVRRIKTTLYMEGLAHITVTDMGRNKVLLFSPKLGELEAILIGGKYGEFMDFDENTASRTKLDVARIKISTSFRGYVDETVKIKAMGVVYNVWVVEEKGIQTALCYGSRNDDQEFSWVDSTNYPAAAVEEGGEVHGGSMEGSEEEDGVDLSASQHHKQGEQVQNDGDRSLAKEGTGHSQPLV
ncbi:hypothetical protein A2U01_0036794, partial [Trifolium medium]|nr:hypothetical protein [Trifolium medium]